MANLTRRRSRAGETKARARYASHPELKGATLVAANLTEKEASELEALDKRWWAAEPGALPLTEKETRRLEELLGALAGDREIFSKKRNEEELRARKAAIAEGIRLGELPRRAEWAEAGSVTLPRFVFTWLQNSRNQDWTVADMGMLAAMLGMFENQISLFENAEFEEDNGELVLVVQGDADNIRFSRSQNRQSTDPFTSSGYVRERVALQKLVQNGWFEVSKAGTGLRIKLGERAKKVREGKEARPQAA